MILMLKGKCHFIFFGMILICHPKACKAGIKDIKRKTLPALEAGFVPQSLLSCQWPTRQVRDSGVFFPCDMCFSCREKEMCHHLWFGSKSGKLAVHALFCFRFTLTFIFLQVCSALYYVQAVLKDKKRSGLLK